MKEPLSWNQVYDKRTLSLLRSRAREDLPPGNILDTRI